MSMELLKLGGFGVFVWPSFALTLISCFILYRQTKKELLLQEQILFKTVKVMPTEDLQKEKAVKEVLSTSLV